MFVCDKCGASIREESNYCPRCGDPVTDSDRASSENRPNISVANVEISFNYSSSPRYQEAVNICKNLSTYKITGNDKQTRHTISLPLTEIDLISNIYDLVGNWKSSKMFINGQLSTKKDLSYHGVGCYKTQLNAYNKKQFCYGEHEYDFNIWGCKRLNMPISQWGGGWLDYGKFDNDGNWWFDKDKILHDLEIRVRENELCPALDKNKVFATLDALPPSVNPKSSNRWQYRTTCQNIDGNYKDVAVGIQPIIKQVNYYVLDIHKPSFSANTAELPNETSDNIEQNKIKTQEYQFPKKTFHNNFLFKIIAALVIILIMYRCFH